MNLQLVKSIVTVIHFFLRKGVEDFIIFSKIDNVFVKNFAYIN